MPKYTEFKNTAAKASHNYAAQEKSEPASKPSWSFFKLLGAVCVAVVTLPITLPASIVGGACEIARVSTRERQHNRDMKYNKAFTALSDFFLFPGKAIIGLFKSCAGNAVSDAHDCTSRSVKLNNTSQSILGVAQQGGVADTASINNPSPNTQHPQAQQLQVGQYTMGAGR